MNVIKHFEQTTTMLTKTNLPEHRQWFLPCLFLLFSISSLFANHFNSNDFDGHWWAVDAGNDQNICIGESVQLMATGANSYVWSPGGGLSCTDCPDPVASPFFTTTYFVMGDDGTIDSVTVNVFTDPVINTVTPGDPTDCNLPNGTIVIDAVGAGALEYSIDAGAVWQNNGTFTALAANTYTIAVRNAGGACEIAGPTVSLAAPVPPQILSVNPTDPTLCDTPNGAIIISSSGGLSPHEYSIDGGQNWQSLNTFQLLPSGAYDVRVRNADGSCEVQGGIFNLSGSPDEADISQILAFAPSNCGETDGLITVLISNDDGGFEYSVDGGQNFQPGNSFTGLGEGMFNIVVRRTDGTCSVDGGAVDLFSTNRPEIFGTSVVQPSGCGIDNGNITILAFGPSTLEFSIDGGASWQVSNVFPGLSGGFYQIFVRNSGGSCSTTGGSVQLTQQPAPVIGAVTESGLSGCGAGDGSISISATGTGSLEYSIDGGANWQASSFFGNLSAGNYDVRVREAGTACTAIYQNNPVVINAPGTPPVINNVFTMAPSNCGLMDGLISINAAGAGTLEYSIDNGATFQASNAFPMLAAGVYDIVVVNMATDCSAFAQAILEDAQTCNDTVFVNINAGAAQEVCLDPSVFNFPGLFTSVGFCGQGSASTVQAISIAGECVMLQPAAGFTGTSPDLICTVHCFNNSAAQCDTTYIQVTVQGMVNCGDLFPEDEVQVIYSGNPTNYCVPVPFGSLAGFDVELEGQPITNPFDCVFSQLNAYLFGALPGGGQAGPYTLVAWTVNGATISGDVFNSPQELTDMMNALDPTGNWHLNGSLGFIGGGDENNNYNTMQVIQNSSNLPFFLNNNIGFQGTGFTISLTSPGQHVLTATNPVTGCSDNLIINAGASPVDPSFEVLTTTVNTPTAPFCLDGMDLPNGFIENLGFCGNPANGASPLVNDSCVIYVPNLNFAGQDEFCVVVCDSGFPQTCDTTFFTVNVLPETDTVNLTIPAGVASIDTCLSSFIIELPGMIEQANFCGINTNEVAVVLDDNCLNVSAVNNFSGLTEVCVEYCSGGVCDETVLLINVEPPIVCEDVFPQNSITVESASETGFVCIPVAPGNIVNYEVLLDGIATTSFAPCNFGNVTMYNYNSLFQGPYVLQSWEVNGTVFSGNFPDIQAMIDMMNVWDPTGNWTNNLFGLTINGGDPNSVYGDLVISDNAGNTTPLEPVVIVLPLGSNLEVTGYGPHQIMVTGADGCTDELTVNLVQHFVNNETLFFETSINTSVTPICANTSELIGGLQSFNFCGLPDNGSVAIIGDTCVSYTPSTNFTGTDGFCLVVCDDYQPTVCDTFFININVQLPTDTVFVDADDVTPFDVCLDGSVIQLPGAIASSFICGANDDEVELALAGNCVTIDLEDTFVGTTTACVVHCTGDIPPICDTTILVIEFDGVFPCDPVFANDQMIVLLGNDTGEVCLPLSISEITNYEVLLDGTAYTNGFAPCEMDTVFEYPYLPSFGLGTLAPYDITWVLNGVVLTGTVDNALALVNLMNGFDPAGNWMLNNPTFRITTSNQNGDYGTLTITDNLGFTENIDPIQGFNPIGSLLQFVGAGQHEIILTETAINCSDTLIINAVDPDNIIEITTFENMPSDQVCIDLSGLPGNFVEMTVCGFPANGSLLIDDECFIYFPLNGYVGTDQACLEICDDMGNCEIWTVAITVEPLCSQYDVFPDGLQQVAAADCADLTAYCIPIELDSIGNFGLLDNGVQYSGDFVACNGTFSQVSLDTGFHELILVHMNTQCSDTLLLDITCTPDDGCGIDALTPTDLFADDCDAGAEFCVSIPIADLVNYVVIENGSSFPAQIGPCSFDNNFVGVALDTGFYELVFQDTVKGCVDTFLVNVSCMPVEDSTINVQVQEMDSLVICLEDYGFDMVQIDSIVNTCVDQGTGNAVFTIDQATNCITILGDTMGVDIGCFKGYFGDTCATLTINVEVTGTCPDNFPGDQIIASTSCENDSLLVCLNLGQDVLDNLSIEVNGSLYTGPLEACGFDSVFQFVYSDLPSMGLIGPYVVEDWTVNGTVFSDTFLTVLELVNFMNIWDPAGGWSATLDPGSGDMLIVGGGAANDYGDMIVSQNFSGLTDTLEITVQQVPSNFGLQLPVAVSTLTFTDNTTQCVETVVADITCVETEIYIDSIGFDMSDTFCLDLSELLGDVASVENICEDLGGQNVGFEIVGECVVFTGMGEGIDTACIVVCDDLNVCDTTIMVITGQLNGIDTMLIAIDDDVVGGEGRPILIDILENDIFVTLNDFNIIEMPANGQAQFLPNGSINYVPDQGYCDDENPDSFTYEICNASGCDTATVTILVRCDNLEIFNAFSPNNDNDNDFFKIKGLQNFPGHHLYIYSRWGNLVYEATNYQSDWDGTWEGKDLPDGTYFFVLDLGLGEKPDRGFVQIRR
ncbi:MAG TPA: gliding motility-associated C-terminal domain-containing protein [Bacteroidetes bacterium]|nr:gliding motility-associated C-terminal domain-containing protein [Bacteroidota bacterium]